MRSGSGASPRSVAISSARTTRRGFRRSVRAASCGAPDRSRTASASRPSRARADSSDARTAGIPGERCRVDAGEHGPQPEPGPAREDPDPAAAAEGRQRVQGVGAEVGHGERLVRLHEIEPVVDDAPTLGRRGLRGPDIEAAVDLSRVRRDDLGRDATLQQVLGENEGEARLAGAGRTADDHQRRTGRARHRGAGRRAGPGVSNRADARRADARRADARRADARRHAAQARRPRSA